MSAGELFELIMPAAFVASALLSTFVLASARKRFSLLYSSALAVGTLVLPLIVFPVYLAIMIWRKASGPPKRWRYTLPLLYAAIVLSAIAVFFYFDSRSIDAHLARAAKAKVEDDYTTAIREYEQALALEDNPHTRKLLAIELTKAGDYSRAISELRLAEAGNEPDDLINFRVGLLLERMNLTNQAGLEFEKFLLSQTCQREDPRCDSARERIAKSH